MRTKSSMIAAVLAAAVCGALVLPACVEDATVEPAVTEVSAGDARVVRLVRSGAVTVATLLERGTVLAELRSDGHEAIYQEPTRDPVTIALDDPEPPLDRLIVHLWTERDTLAPYGARWCLKCIMFDDGSMTCQAIDCPPKV